MNNELLSKRYFQGEEKSWSEVVSRVAGHAAGKDQLMYDAYRELMLEEKFFPSRMTYMGTENPFASSCFVFPVEDSLTGIMQTLSDACQVQKYGGGTGYNFSNLRPKGDLISTSGGEASGPVSFMSLFHQAMEVVHRAGKKHSAQMAILNADHPDIFEFITCKDQEGALWTFNISVGVTDAFIQAVQTDDTWDLQFKGKRYKTIQAKALWDTIIEHAWHNGDPGIIFLDTVNSNNCYPEPIEACNPCGEQMLPPYVSCNLGSLNLAKFVSSGKVLWEDLQEATKTAVMFLDGSVDNAFWPVKAIEEKTKKYKNIGLGVMGWADMLIKMSIPYDSKQAVELASNVMEAINTVADDTSWQLVGAGANARKNVTVTSIAPTGSISLLAGCSSGIEPLFGVVTTKNTYVGSFENVVNPLFEEIARDEGFYSEALMKEIAEVGSIQDIESIPRHVKELFKTANEIGYEWHVKHQAAFQRWVDNAVSKTINLPNEATTDNVADAYMRAWLSGCKSITVYRDGSRQVQVVDTKKKDREMCPNCQAILFMKDGSLQCVTCGYKPGKQETITKRPDILDGKTYRKETPLGTAFITLNHNNTGPFEAFIEIGKAGSEASAVSEAMGRLISLILRMPAYMSQDDRLKLIGEQLIGIGGARPLGFGGKRVLSMPDGVAQVILDHLDTGVDVSLGDICPDCGLASFIYSEGCRKCLSCGYSEC